MRWSGHAGRCSHFTVHECAVHQSPRVPPVGLCYGPCLVHLVHACMSGVCSPSRTSLPLGGDTQASIMVRLQTRVGSAVQSTTCTRIVPLIARIWAHMQSTVCRKQRPLHQCAWCMVHNVTCCSISVCAETAVSLQTYVCTVYTPLHLCIVYTNVWNLSCCRDNPSI